MTGILAMALLLGPGGLADDKDKDPVGTWQLSYEINGEQRTSTLAIKKDGDGHAGTISWPDQKDEKLKDVKCKDGKLTFAALRKIGDNEIPITYELTVDAAKLKGKGEVEFNGDKREFDIEGKREKKDK